MGLSDESEENVLQRFEEVCLDLNMDTSTKEDAWQNYQRMQTNYSLEGDQMHWLACALYEACRRTSVPTVGQGTMEGNCVSLTRLLRSSKFSLIQFFNKMRKWSDMANLPKAFRDKIDKLERNFAVSTVIFKKFEPIFLDIFINPAHELPRQQRGRKQRAIHDKRRKWTKNGLQLVEGRLPCTAKEVFSFSWTLFVLVKGNFPAISDDLVNSYHLLLCCIDWIFANAVMGGRKDLLNREFEGLPEDFNSVNWKPSGDPPCIMQLLCEKHDGLVVEAKTIKEHWWKPHIKRLFDKKILDGKSSNLSAILELGHFEENVKMINKLYEEYVLSVGDFDERIFLGEDASEEIGTPGGQNTSDLTEQMQRRSLRQHFDETKSLTPSTPLTGRRYLKEKDLSVTPVSTATQSVSRLQTLLSGSKTSPSDTLLDIFKNCARNPIDEITQRLKEMGEKFCKHYAKSSDSHPGATVDFARKRLQLGESLYYKTLEGIIQGEKRRLGGEQKEANLLGLLENDFFHRSLLACCLEIVIFSYNSQRTFPWIVDIFELSPYHFYKVIEIIIRAEKGLSRDVVKHLNHIEESILESYAWKNDSPLWDAIKEKTAPTCEEVTPANQMELSGKQSALQIAKHPRLRSLVGDIKYLQKSSDPLQSPIVPMATDRFSSPSPGNAKRRLFTTGPTTASPLVTSSAASTQSSTSQSINIVSSGKATIGGSILMNQLKGGTTDTLIVSNKLASALAPTANSSKVDSAPQVTVASSGLTSPVTGGHVVVAAAAGSGTVLTSSVGQQTTVPTQQTIVAMMDDGRQILIPIQIAQPSTSGTSTTSMTYTTSGTSGQTSSTITITSKSGQPMFVKLEKTDADHNYNKPKQTGSLALFFRKVYHLASVRLRDLFDKLDIDDEELLKKVWTCFEYAMVHNVHLMMDRHLDQLIMCSLYLIAKVTEKPLTFQNIMKCYRLQPQAHSHVYRSVLISSRHRHGSGSSDSNEGSGTSSPVNEGKPDNKDKKQVSVRSSSTLPHPHPSSQPPTPTRFVGGNLEDLEEERGDLIQFYNLVYLRKTRTFALMFVEKNSDPTDKPKLSPLPAIRCLSSSPRRVSNSHTVFISPHRANTLPPLRGMSYSINLSPSKDLLAINKMIKQGIFKTSSKRVLEVDKDDSVHSPAKRMAAGQHFVKRIQDLPTVENPSL
ncbi:retinoblastoma-like protein 1 [Biomphalaria glabrata]|uniref:Retinoblastoma-like protein 1 n=1 Tax=Biomphalaria glabrata TaxID=6526 RepID=A0A9W3AV91_BIOGL|nr:retinoblastoma-like protein 1 isoform X1 [Biomphalaria glabrata]KAI8762237.1 retinoblastoma-like protein 1 [Biomphalaria glabrata]